MQPCDELVTVSPRLVILLVHGTFAKAHPWTRNSRLVATLKGLPGTSVCECDWPGTNSIAGRLDGVTEVASKVATVLDRFSGAQLILIGHSHGGTICLQAINRLADQHSERVRGVVCLGTPFLRAEARSVWSKSAWEAVKSPFKTILWLVALIPPSLVMGYLQSRFPHEGVRFIVWMAICFTLAPVVFWLALRFPTPIASTRELLFDVISEALSMATRALGLFRLVLVVVLGATGLLAFGAAGAIWLEHALAAGTLWPVRWNDAHTILQQLSYLFVRPLWDMVWPWVTGHGVAVLAAATWVFRLIVTASPLLAVTIGLTLLATALGGGAIVESNVTHHRFRMTLRQVKSLLEVSGPRSARLLLVSSSHDEVGWGLRLANAVASVVTVVWNRLSAVIDAATTVRHAISSRSAIGLFVVGVAAIGLAGTAGLLSDRATGRAELIWMMGGVGLYLLPIFLVAVLLPSFMVLATFTCLALSPFSVDLLWYGPLIDYRVETTPMSGVWSAHDVTDPAQTGWAHSVYDNPKCVELVTNWISGQFLA